MHVGESTALAATRYKRLLESSGERPSWGAIVSRAHGASGVGSERHHFAESDANKVLEADHSDSQLHVIGHIVPAFGMLTVRMLGICRGYRVPPLKARAGEHF